MKKYPGWLPKHSLKTSFELGDDVSHPVLDALGGEQGLRSVTSLSALPTSRKLERMGKACGGCGVLEFRKQLFRCAKCKIVCYW